MKGWTHTLPMRDLVHAVREVERTRLEQDAALANVNVVHKKLGSVGATHPERWTETLAAKLVKLYEQVHVLTRREQTALAALEAHLNEALGAHTPSPTARKRGYDSVGPAEAAKGTKKAKGATYLPTHTKVAAKTPHGWMLSSIVRFDSLKDKYLVQDADPVDTSLGPKKTFHVASRYIVPLHTLTGFEGDIIDLPKGTGVLAIFPDTSCFYPAVVVRGAKRRRDRSFVLHFEDDYDEQGAVPERVVPYEYVILDPTPRKAEEG